MYRRACARGVRGFPRASVYRRGRRGRESLNMPRSLLLIRINSGRLPRPAPPFDGDESDAGSGGAVTRWIEKSAGWKGVVWEVVFEFGVALRWKGNGFVVLRTGDLGLLNG